ncbi:hypothetical protein Rin_00015370 [Candidatus Regiella insecticola 5.15]|uniref:DUF1640 domain-containing protein n=1 Tax=Candidatus Regiella insecticola 5.15 TaxID=1005043 RepID=G2H0F9_9ENTR|nr:hypothetical protein [Candidatus Regiella insecticola]EGY28523.1 hypothetical protein Rin_00015370 [Candidatus Regiella insecticola 5.15]
MNQATFVDTHKIFKKLEKTGISTNQAEAFSEIFRESHEAVDVATRRDLEDVRKELSGDIAEVKRDIIDVRKDMEFRFEKTDAQIADVRKDFMAEMSLIRKDIEKSGMQTTIKLGGMLVVAVGVILAVLKIPF